MEELGRRAAVALKAAERPDVRALRSKLSAVEKNFDDLIELQDEEIERLRRLLVSAANAHRANEATFWKHPTKVAKLMAVLGEICLEADAIAYAGDLLPKRGPVRRRNRG